MKNFHSQQCRAMYSYTNEEKGAVFVLMALFMMGMIGLLTLAVDGHFMLQSRLEEQNIAEYFALAAMTGYENYENGPPGDFEAKRNAAIELLSTIQTSNAITGIEQEWNFNEHSCDGAHCSGDGWALTFGQWYYEDNSFNSGESDLVDMPIDAITLELQFQKNNLLQFFSKSENDSGSIKVNTVAYRVGNKLRLAKITASGKAYEAGVISDSE
jgi:uncharacterized membrane protein